LGLEDTRSRSRVPPPSPIQTPTCGYRRDGAAEPLFDYSPVPFFIMPKSFKMSPSKLIHLTSAAVATKSTKRGGFGKIC
ncbi:hypothetical protein M8C21_027744, partial [Ambrosia artemisiifolia]